MQNLKEALISAKRIELALAHPSPLRFHGEELYQLRAQSFAVYEFLTKLSMTVEGPL